MSKVETTFLKWFGSIAAGLIIASTIGLLGMYRASGIISEKVKANESNIIEVKKYHEKDVLLIRISIKDIRADQKIIMSDIKEILKQTK